MSSFRDLQIWQKGMDLSVLIYKYSLEFPKEELYGLVSQARRSATSVPLNISEGWGRGSDKSFANFLKIARASLYELETIIEISFRLDYLKKEDMESIFIQIEELGKMINGFIKKLNE